LRPCSNAASSPKDTHERVLRIAPPLVIDDDAIDFLLARYGEALASL
jgi:4-aminobutyrate aminotransferase-like enzyme